MNMLAFKIVLNVRNGVRSHHRIHSNSSIAVTL